MNKVKFIFLMCLSLPLQAQDAPESLRQDITELIATRTALSIRGAAESYGKAFVQEVCTAQFAKAFRDGQVIEDEEKTDCPAATYWSNANLKQFERRDYDTEAVINRIQAILNQSTWDEETTDNQLRQLYEKVAKAYRPILRQRESKKEKEILTSNAGREGVQTLKFGVQMEIEAGDTPLKEINRGTRETGVAFYTRVTRKLRFDELPEAIRLQAEQIPAAKSWTFWVPADAAAQVEEHKAAQAQAAQEKRNSMMQRLLGNRSTNARVKASAEQETETERSESEPVMLKIKVWKDDPAAPVQTLPDVVTDMF